MFFETRPKWKEISEKEYLRAVKKYAPVSTNLLEEPLTYKKVVASFEELDFYSHYRKEPIYEERGWISKSIIQQLSEEPVGYKYYKKVGEERVLVINQKEADAIKKSGLDMTKRKDFVRFFEEYHELMKL